MKSFAVLQLSGCAGCEVSLLNASDWIDKVKLSYMPLVITAHTMPEVDVLLISGSVQSDEDLYNLRKSVRKPGDPEPLTDIIATVRELTDAGLPTFGICLGHQLLGLASGARTLKMKFGHHGANHPVQDLDSGRVMITSQNHGFAVDPATVPATLRLTHKSLFDGSNQGIARTDVPAFSFQGHPEASPGPHDVAYLFDRFISMMQQQK